MIAIAGAIFLFIAFLSLFNVFGLVEKSGEVLRIANQSLEDLRSKNRDDHAKEKALQHHAKRLFTLFFLLTLGGLGALLIPVSLIWALDQFEVLSFDAVIDVTLSWPFLLVSTVLAIIFFRFMHKRTT